MNTAESLVLEEEKKFNELVSFKQYVSGIVKDIPDVWDVSEYEKKPDTTININFKWASGEINKMCKYWAWNLLRRQGFQASSVRNMIAQVYFFFEFAKKEQLPHSGDKKHYRAWDKYIEDLRQRVKNSIVVDGKDPLQPRTASQYTSNALLFLAQLANVVAGYEWVFKRDATSLLSHDISSYLTGQERKDFRDKLVKLQFQHKTKVIPYDKLLILTRALEKCQDIYLKTALKIALHTGLRITEVLILKRGCLVPVSKEEITSASAYRKKHKIGLGGVDPDWSEMYWLQDHQVIKDKKSMEWSRGTSILVSKVVFDAIKELENFTEALREDSGSEYLFINKVDGRVRVRSYSALQQAKQKFIKKGLLPYFNFHQTRATFATILYDLGIPEEMIQKYLNHINVETTSGYISSDYEQEYMEMSAVAAGKMLGINMKDKKVDSFVGEVVAAASASEWDQLDYFDQLAVYSAIKRKYGLSVVYYDHGFCMLGVGEKCEHGYGDVKPCHISECGSFEPDRDELPTFVEMLLERRKAAPELKKLYDSQMVAFPEHKEDLLSRMKEFEDDTLALVGLVKKLEMQVEKV